MIVRYRYQLTELMRELGLPMIAAEVGCAEGRFSEELLNAGIEKLYCIDNWGEIVGQKGDGGSPEEWHYKNYMTALYVLEPFKERVVVLKGMSVAMASNVPDNSLGMVYVDCDHSYEGVMKDLVAWFPKLVEGGICAGHDYINGSYGVAQAVGEFCKDKCEVHTIHENKEEDAGFWFRKI